MSKFKKSETKTEGNYKIVKICLEEILALRQINYSWPIIQSFIKASFNKDINIRNLATNLSIAQKKLRDAEEVELDPDKKKALQEAKLNREVRINELMNNPRLIETNFKTKGEFFNQNNPGFKERRAPQPGASAQTKAAAPSSPPKPQLSANITVAPASDAQVEPTQEQKYSEETLEMWETLKKYLVKSGYPYNENNVVGVLKAIEANPALYRGINPFQLYEKFKLLLK